MAKNLDNTELVTFQELLMANSMEVDTVTNLLINLGIFTEQELYLKLNEIKSDHLKNE
jgi:hypothetical protein